MPSREERLDAWKLHVEQNPDKTLTHAELLAALKRNNEQLHADLKALTEPVSSSAPGVEATGRRGRPVSLKIDDGYAHKKTLAELAGGILKEMRRAAFASLGLPTDRA